MRIAALALLASLVAGPALAQCKPTDRNCIEVDLRLLSAGFGYGAGRITDLASGTPNRAMMGLNLRLDVFILSRIKGLPFATYDALFTDMTWGKRTGDPLRFGTLDEDNSAMPFVIGYHFVAGLRRNGVAVMGGLGYQHFDHDIGGTLMSGSATPITGRVEVGENGRLVAMAWVAPGSKGMMAARVDLHVFRNLNLMASYWQAKGIAQPWDQPTGTEVSATASMFVVGFRTAELR